MVVLKWSKMQWMGKMSQSLLSWALQPGDRKALESWAHATSLPPGYPRHPHHKEEGSLATAPKVPAVSSLPESPP